jgi:endonuclease III-like uncharacterized protein
MKTRVVIFRTTEKLVKDLEAIVKSSGYYRNKTELINEILRNFVKNYNSRRKK